MQKKIAKLILAVVILAGSLGTGLAPKVASAAALCPPICCDPHCYGIRPCTWISGRCVCSQFCQPNLPDGPE